MSVITGSKSRILGKRLWRIPAIVIVLVAIKLLIHLLTAANYGLFRDELYFLVWGYVDQPPLVAGLAWLDAPSLGRRCLASTSSQRWPEPVWWR